MSIKVMNRVWENSNACGGELLVLLAIADHADDHGFAWPGIDSLAKKSRLSSRHVTRCLNYLAGAGELRIQANRGRRGTNLYQVVCFPPSGSMSALPTKCQEDKACQGDRCLSQMSPEPSEPSEPPTHTIDATVITEPVSEWPAEDEVLKHARTYPGNLAFGISAKAMTEDWARDYWSWRTYDEERWPKRWTEEMFRRFEREWRDGGRGARGHGKKSARGANDRPSDEPPAPMKSGLVSLSMMRAAVE